MKTLARERDKAEILGRLRTVRPESVRRWGRMSAHQMVCHLADCVSHGPGREAGEPRYRAAATDDPQVVSLCTFPCPGRPEILTSPEIDQERGGTRPVDFATDVAQVEALLELVTAERGVSTGSLIRFSAPCPTPPGSVWAYLHADHHLRQFGA